ncbi:FmdB family zinc ribbon protein [Maridesulfovibrio bastinii]|uniref:FmdB family zinc ribbon protein n=1 Tax=Maridesulfovibrio bastinii TaxID=47157 RepID=UPI0004039055|nr:FmdB family zinc ribbon protein [Maridesulfovibrio bastinii]
MPIYEYKCLSCGELYEEITLGSQNGKCPFCGSGDREKVLSPSSSLTNSNKSIPGKGDTACCGGSPGASGCIPGSCCGKNR